VRERKKAIEVSAFSLVREFIRLAALDDRRAFKSAGPVIIKRSINIDKRIDRDRSFYRYSRGKRQKFFAVFPRKISYRANGAFAPENIIGKGRDVAHVNSSADHAAAFCARPERKGHKFSGRGKNDGCIERRGRRLADSAGPGRAERPGEGLSLIVVLPSKCVHIFAEKHRRLRDDMRCRAESVKADTTGFPGKGESAEPDEPSAKKRRGFFVAESGWNGETESFVGDRELRESAVNSIAGEARLVAEIFPAAFTVTAYSAGGSEPGHTDAVINGEPGRALSACGNRSDDLVAADERPFRRWELSVNDMEVGTAYPAGAHPYEHLVFAGRWNGNIHNSKWCAWFPEDRSFHRKSFQNHKTE